MLFIGGKDDGKVSDAHGIFTKFDEGKRNVTIDKVEDLTG